MSPFRKDNPEKKFKKIRDHIEKTQDKIRVLDYIITKRDAEIIAKEQHFKTLIDAGREPSNVQKVTHMRRMESLSMLQDARELVNEELDKMLETVVLGKSLTKAQEELLDTLEGSVDDLVNWRDNERMFDQAARKIIDDFDKMYKGTEKKTSGKERSTTEKEYQFSEKS